MNMKKNCAVCGNEFEDLSPNKIGKYCSRKCCKKADYIRNKESLLKQQKEYHQNNREERLKKMRKYHHSHRDFLLPKMRLYQKEYRQRPEIKEKLRLKAKRFRYKRDIYHIFC